MVWGYRPPTRPTSGVKAKKKKKKKGLKKRGAAAAGSATDDGVTVRFIPSGFGLVRNCTSAAIAPGPPAGTRKLIFIVALPMWKKISDNENCNSRYVQRH